MVLKWFVETSGALQLIDLLGLENVQQFGWMCDHVYPPTNWNHPIQS